MGLQKDVSVTYAIYDDAPIACQGDDDRDKIKVIKDRFSSADAPAEALRRSLIMAGTRGHVQVWDIQVMKDDMPC